MGCAVALDRTTLAAFVYNDIPFARVCLHADRIHHTAAFVCAVSGVLVYVKRTEAARTVVARAVAKWFDRMSAVCADKVIIVFGKAFLFHNTPVYNMQNNE